MQQDEPGLQGAEETRRDEEEEEEEEMLSQPSHLDFGVRGAVIFVAAAFAASAPSASAYEASGNNRRATIPLYLQRTGR